MLTVKEWMELVDYRITEGSEYGWQCFGPKAYSLSSWNGEHDGWSFNIVFDTETQTVYTVEVCDYARDRAYRLMNPDYKQAHDKEAKSHNVNPKEAWDECDFVDLEEDDDFIQKGLAIKADEDYDTRVSVPLTVPDDVLFELMKKAHEKDITLNQLVEEVLQTAIQNEKNKRAVEDDTWDNLADDDLWDDEVHYSNTDNPIDFPFPAPAMKKAKKKKKK